MGRRTTAGFANTDTGSRQEQLQKILRATA
jgi:hypothetical protein